MFGRATAELSSLLSTSVCSAALGCASANIERLADSAVFPAGRSWQAVAAPKGLPADVRAKLEAEFIASLRTPDVKARFDQIGFDVVGNTSAQFAEFLAAEIARWKLVIETGKITAE